MRLIALLIVLTSAPILAVPGPDYGRVYDPGRDPYADARDAIARAAESGRHVLIVVGGDWCVWCDELDRVFKQDPGARAILESGFVVLKVNVSDANPNSDFMAAMPRLEGYPQIFVADGDGQLIRAQDPASFLSAGRYAPDRVRAFLRRWAPGRP
ncbi:MAG: thioredoxin family protein [Gammaproteobacteria bacterium]